MDLVALLEQHRPDRLAVATASASLTYAELLAAARDSTLCRALVARDAIETAVALVAAVIADDTLVVIDPAAPEPEVARTLDRFDRDGLPAGLGLSTSGVTGEPRSVVRPWSSVAANAAAFADGLGLTPDDVVLTTSAMHHSYAVSAGLCGALAAGASFVAPGGLVSPAVLAGHIDGYRVTVLLSVPMLFRWYTAGVPAAHPPRLCVSAGAPIGADLRAAWDKNVGWPLVEHYGTSELGQLTVATPDDGGTVGRPLRGIRVRATLPTDTGDHELEVAVAGPPAVLLDAPPRQLTGWVATGDTGVVDDEGRVTITGRLGDTVNVGGKKVALREVEDVLRALPGVRDAAVVTYGDDPMVPKLCGFVESDGEFDESAVLAAVRARLAPHKVPRRVVRLPGLPKTGSGKVRRRDLRLLATPETVDVPFAGPGAGASPLTWGGRAIRHSIDWLGTEAHYFNDRHVLPLPDGIALDTVTGALAALVSRHQAMRAYYPTVDGDVVLRVAGEGTLPVTVYSLPQGDALEFAERVARESGRVLFGEDELPLRCAVVRSAGVPRFLVLVLSHQSIDAWTVDILLDELRRLWAGEALPERPWQLLDQAADEATGDSRRRGEAALRRWAAFYATADAAMFDLPARQPEPKPIRSVIMTSPATELGSRLVATPAGRQHVRGADRDRRRRARPPHRPSAGDPVADLGQPVGQQAARPGGAAGAGRAVPGGAVGRPGRGHPRHRPANPDGPCQRLLRPGGRVTGPAGGRTGQRRVLRLPRSDRQRRPVAWGRRRAGRHRSGGAAHRDGVRGRVELGSAEHEVLRADHPLPRHLPDRADGRHPVRPARRHPAGADRDRVGHRGGRERPGAGRAAVPGAAAAR